jgi:hypothetical protein
LSYPLQQHSRRARALFRELLEVHEAEIPAVFQKTVDYL